MNLGLTLRYRHRWALLSLMAAVFLFTVGVAATAAQNEPRTFDCSTVIDVPQTECEALVDLYNHMNGAFWDDNTGWLTDITVCTWYGLACNGGNVAYLSVSYNNAVGPIPASIGDLTELIGLDLSTVTGALPSELGTLTQLQTLNIRGAYSNTEFVGPLPDLSGLSQLTALNIENGAIGGEIPAWVNQTNFPNLTHLVLAQNGFTGEVPSGITTMTGLTVLQLYNNNFSGNFPDFSATCDTLENFWIGGSANNFTAAPFPAWLNATDCPNLTNLNVARGGFTGEFPDLSGLALEGLVISNNLFDVGPVPTWLVNKTGILYLQLSNTFRNGTLPEFASADTLESLQLDNNRFTGGIPASYNATNYPNLYNVNFFGNNLTSIDPSFASFATSPNSTYTSVYLNALIPSSLDGAVQDYLDTVNAGWRIWQVVPPTTFSINPLEGGTTATAIVTPIDIINYFNVNYVVEASTNAGGPYTVVGSGSAFGGTVTPLAINLTGLTPETTYYFVVKTRVGAGYGTAPVINFYFRDSLYSAEQSATTLEADSETDCANTTIPEAECNALVALYNNHNGVNWNNSTGWFTGSPCTWYGITCSGGNVTQVALPGNKLSGALPDLSALSELMLLDLSSNMLSGGIPTWLTQHGSLQLLNLSNNNLNGTIPNLSALVSLTDLYLASNSFTGGFPTGLSTNTNLNRLYLDFNQLDGTIPDLSAMSGLLMLTIYNNNFSGTLPELPSSNFFFLGAAGNRFSGEIPASYGSLTQLTGLALDANALTGEIPASLAQMPNLGVGMVLSYVGFSYNALTATDPDLLDFLAEEDPDFAQTQTIPPTNLATGTVGDTSVQVTWTAIDYTDHNGYYEVGYRIGNSGEYTFLPANRTADKTGLTVTVGGLTGATEYCFVARTITLPHLTTANYFIDNKNTLTSANSAGVCATTTNIGTPTNKPTATILVSPTGNQALTGTKSPVLVWQENPIGEQVTTYKVTLKNSANVTLHNKNYAASAVCVGGTCSLDLSGISPRAISLPNGAYNWQITAINVVGNTKSVKATFRIVKPTKPTLAAPIGNVILNTPTPTLTFDIPTGENITSIKITVSKVNATKAAFTQTVTPTDICVGASCSLTVPTALGNGAYTWTAQLKNVNGNSAAKGTFKIAFPDKATGLTPTANATIDTQKPTLSWDEVSNATEYRVTIKHIKSGKKVVLGWVASGATGFTCDMGVCSLDMATFTGAPNLQKNAHEWFVEARNLSVHAKSKSKSAIAKFKVVLPTRDAQSDTGLTLPPSTFRAP